MNVNIFYPYKIRKFFKDIFSEGKLHASRKDFSSVNFSADETSELISKWIKEKKPFIVSRFGNVELEWFYHTSILDKNLFWRLYYFLTFKTDSWRKMDYNIKHPYFQPSNLENSLFYRKKNARSHS